MAKNTTTRLENLQRELDKRSPAEPLRIQVYYVSHWPDGEGELAYEMVVDGEQPRVINLKWPEDE